ncbi:IS630 family transposase [Muricomes intestini]|jgi:transposase|uniref:IS630 family transposase n=1 Tax=Muricomes intestini TaxID=1796634 RepID=UPI002FE07841
MCLRKPLKKIAEFEEHFTELAHESDDNTVILFEDESYIRDYQALCATWVKKGKQKKIKTYGQHKGVGLFGVLEYRTGNIIVDTAEQLNAQAFEAYLDNFVLPAYTGKKIIMILDNGKIHHAKVLASFKEVHPELEFMFLPPYAPCINRIEGLWKWLKHDAICNVFFKDISAIKRAVLGFISSIKFHRSVIRKRLCW